MSTQTKQCDACKASVTFTGHRGFGPAHTACPMKGQSAVSPDHKPCPVHGVLTWAVGPYSTFRTCHTYCTAGKRGKPWRYCAPRGEHSGTDSGQDTDDTDDDTDAQPKAPAPHTPPVNGANHLESKQEGTDVNATPEVTAALQALMGALQPKAPAVDPAAIQAMVNAAVDAKLQAEAKITLVIESAKSERRVEVEHPHPYLARAIKLVEAGIPIYLYGTAGGGKTTAGYQIAKALGVECEIDTLDRTTSRSMIQGFMSAAGERVHTSFSRCYTTGKLYLADELDLSPGQVQTLKNSSLANGHAPFAWGNEVRHERFYYVGAGNTPGMPTREYPDRQPMSQAFKDRLYFMHWPVDEQAERAWAGVGGKAKNRIPALPEPREITAEAWVNFVQNLRDWARTNAPTLQITPRASLVGLKALACGETPDQVADGLIFRGADAELRTKALAAVKLP